MKKIVSVFLAVVLVVSMSSVAFAADGGNPDLSVVSSGDVGSFGFPVSAVVDTSTDVITFDFSPFSLSSGKIAYLKDWVNSSSNVLYYTYNVSLNKYVLYFIIAPLSSSFSFSYRNENSYDYTDLSCSETCKFQFYFSDGWDGNRDFAVTAPFGSICDFPSLACSFVSGSYFSNVDYSLLTPAIKDKIVRQKYLIKDNYGIFDNWSNDVSVLYPLVTVNYNYEDGSVASPAVSKEYNRGDSYSISSPAIDGYYPSLNVVDGVNLTGNVSVNVIYKPIEYSVLVNYSYADGSEAFPTVNSFYHLGDKYNIASPVLNGYIPSFSTVSGEIIKGSETTLIYDVVYKKLPINLTVNYKYDNGSQAVPSYVNSFYEGDKYEIVSPKISGFAPNPSVIRGTVPLNSSDMVFDVVYSPSLAIVSADDFAPFISGFIVGLTSLVATGLLLYIALLSVRLIPSIFEWFTKM